MVTVTKAQKDRVFLAMRVHDERITGDILQAGFEDLPPDFTVDDAAASLTERGVTNDYKAARRLIQRLRKAGLIAKHGGMAGQGVRWRKEGR